MVAKGEVDINKVRERLAKMLAPEDYQAVAEAYADAYRGTNLDADAIFEELICDSLGNMNIFVGRNDKTAKLFKDWLPEIKSAASESKSPTQTRGSPTSKAVYNKRDGKDGWGKVYGTAQEALNDAIKSVDTELWNAFNEEIDSKKVHTPITNAIIAVQQDVRQNTITPIQGAKLLSEVYQKGGRNALARIYNGETGNLFSQALERAKQHSTSAGEVTEGKASRVPPMDEYSTNAMQWAYSDKTEMGEQKMFYRKGKWVLLEKTDDGFVEMGTYSDKQRNIIAEEIQAYNEQLHNQRTGERAKAESLRKDFMLFESSGNSNSRDNLNGVRGSSSNERVGSLHQGESESNRSTSNESGKHNNGRFSRELDSDGNELSEEQVEFFKDSKVRDANGNLLVVRHGTNAEFNVFDFSKIGSANGKAEGYGFYFSDDYEITSRYGKNQKEVYLNITKPLSKDKITIQKAEFTKFVNALIDFDVLQYDDEGLTWQDSFVSNYVYTYDARMTKQRAVREFVDQLWDYHTNDVDLIYEVATADGKVYSPDAMREFYDVLGATLGYDGIIAEWTNKDGTSKVYVTFKSEQSKNVSNKAPTTNPDIRFSRELDFIDFINEQAGEESDPNLTKTQNVAKVRGELERMNVAGEAALLAEIKNYMHKAYMKMKRDALYPTVSSISLFESKNRLNI